MPKVISWHTLSKGRSYTPIYGHSARFRRSLRSDLQDVGLMSQHIPDAIVLAQTIKPQGVVKERLTQNFFVAPRF